MVAGVVLCYDGVTRQCGVFRYRVSRKGMSRSDITSSCTLSGDSFGGVLRHYRLAVGLTQEALAAAAGLSVRGISDLERGVNRAPRPDTLRLLAEALRLSPQERVQFMAHAPRSGAGVLRDLPPLAAPALPPLVGRDRELAALQAFLAADGPPVLLL